VTRHEIDRHEIDGCEFDEHEIDGHENITKRHICAICVTTYMALI